MNGVAHAGYAPQTGPGQPASPRPWRRWLLAATVAWAVLLAALTWFSVRSDPPTVREQRTLTQAGPVVDGAVGELVAAAGANLLALSPPTVERGCRVSPFVDGATLLRGVDVLVPGGAEQARLEEIADRLPADWRAGVRLTVDGPRLRADAGEFVAVAGRTEGEGRLRLTVDTGCRPVGDGYLPAVGGAGPEADALGAALTALGRPAEAQAEVAIAPCPGGGEARTLRSAVGPDPASLPGALASLAAGAAVVDNPDWYAYRRDQVTVLAERVPDGARVSATSPCAG